MKSDFEPVGKIHLYVSSAEEAADLLRRAGFKETFQIREITSGPMPVVLELLPKTEGAFRFAVVHQGNKFLEAGSPEEVV